MTHLITLNPGYPSEQTVNPQQLEVPDLWPLAQALKDGPITRSKSVQAQAGADVLETWHLAHALKEYIRKEAARMPFGPPLDICPGCMAEELLEIGRVQGAADIGAAYILAAPVDCQSQRHPVEV